MSYTIKSLQKSLSLLQNELQDIGHTHSKNHIHDMYLQFQMLAQKVSEQQTRDLQKPESFEFD